MCPWLMTTRSRSSLKGFLGSQFPKPHRTSRKSREDIDPPGCPEAASVVIFRMSPRAVVPGAGSGAGWSEKKKFAETALGCGEPRLSAETLEARLLPPGGTCGLFIEESL